MKNQIATLACMMFMAGVFIAGGLAYFVMSFDKDGWFNPGILMVIAALIVAIYADKKFRAIKVALQNSGLIYE